jgi:hypothetical protein
MIWTASLSQCSLLRAARLSVRTPGSCLLTQAAPFDKLARHAGPDNIRTTGRGESLDDSSPALYPRRFPQEPNQERLTCRASAS